jgi:hypothetical protein
MRRAAALLFFFLGCARHERHEPNPPTEQGGTGTRAKGEEGSMGDPHIARMAALREAAEFGMIGVLDGEGGGGRGEGVTAWAKEAPGWTGVRAGEWDDNASYREFQSLLKNARGQHTLDVSNRQFLVARDVDGKGIASCAIDVTDAAGNKAALRTMASGRSILFPRAEGLSKAPFSAHARCGGNLMTASWSPSEDAVVELRGKEPRGAKPFAIDVGFALDTTGSMGEEIDAVKATLRKVAIALRQTSVRVGIVEYKDRGDELVTRVYPMETDLEAFAGRVNGIVASGGGDTPESMSAGIHDAVEKLEWREEASARLLFVIADAPPHLDYSNEPDYTGDARAAARKGIQIHGIAASGMDDLGQMVLRQIAQYTGGTELFVLRGGAGPASTGGGDPLSSCGGTQAQYRSGNLDALILAHIEAARKAQDEDPMAIRGLKKDVVPAKCKS